MSQKRSEKVRKRQGRKRREGARQASRPPAWSDEPDLDDSDPMAELERALAQPHPLAFLEGVSAVVSALDPRLRSPLEQSDDDDDDEDLDLGDFVESFIGVDLPLTTAVLRVVAAMSGNDLTAARIRRELVQRHHALPSWLDDLGSVRVYRAVEMTHVLGDGDNVLLGARLPAGQEMTAVVYVDHNLGTLVKDGFTVPEPIADLLTMMQQQIADPDTTFVDLEPRDARAKIDEAIDTGAHTHPPLESDSWPMCRPLVEWLTRSMPAGGQAYARPEWGEADQRRLADDFVASAHGAGLDDHQRSLLESIVWYGVDYGIGDPTRWSPMSVELLLVDWIPRKIVADAAYLSGAPDVLRAFVAFCHERAGVREELTRQTLRAVDHYEPDYQRLIRSPRLQGPAALLAAAGLLGDSADGELPSFEELMLATLGREVGGDEPLRSMDGTPLPDEPFDWAGIPDDVHGRVDEVLGLVDTCCDEVLGQECRTACRRLLAQVAAGDPVVFRRAGAARTAAAALCWIIAKANDLFGAETGQVRAQHLMARFGVKGSPSQRAGTLLRAAGVDPDQFGGMRLGSPAYLTGRRRAQLIAQRDRYLTPT